MLILRKGAGQKTYGVVPSRERRADERMVHFMNTRDVAVRFPSKYYIIGNAR